MGRPALEVATPSALAPALLRWTRANGGDCAAVGAAGGLLPADIDAETAAITAKGLSAMLDEAARECREPHLGLRLPAELPYLRYDAATLAVRTTQRVGAVLDMLEKFGALVFPQLEVRVSERDSIELSARVRSTHRPSRHVDLYVLSYALHHCRRDALDLVPRRVRFTHARQGDIAPLVSAFGTDDLHFGAEHMSIELSKDDALRLQAGDPLLAQVAHEVAAAALGNRGQHDSATAAVLRCLHARFEGVPSSGVLEADSVARALGMSGRTLQRRLESEGTRFSDLVARAREGEARRRTRETDIPLSRIAEDLGFSDVASFSRAFKRWTGVPPGSYRRLRSEDE